MKRPPILMRVQIHGEEERFPLWLPLFLLLPLALLLLIILSPLILVAIIVIRVRGRQLSPIVGSAFGMLCSVRCIRAAWEVLCSMPGLRVDVRNRNERVYVSII
ncbi:MAG: hypothetical protein OEV54_03985 [Dehalococcoidia bacterium]|nr:hypothetical protein [Dehalococcoidia bacterium]